MADSWHDRANELTQEGIRQDHDDLNNEVGGRDVGRIKRFVSPEHIGDEAAKADDDVFLMNVASQLLTMEQQRQVERLQRQFELYDQATTLALAEIDEEIALAQARYQEIYDSSTILEGDIHAFKDETDGNFYNKNDQLLSDEKQIEAHRKYKTGDSHRRLRQQGAAEIEVLQDERKEVVEFENRQNKLEQRAKDNPQDAAKIRNEFEQTPAPKRIQKKHDQLAGKEVTTSFAKEQFADDGIDAELSAMPAFHHAGGFEQAPTEPVQKPEPNNIPPKSSPELTMG